MAFETDGEGSAARSLRRMLLFAVCAGLLALFALWRMDNPRVDRVRMSLVDAARPLVEQVSAPLGFFAEMAADFENFSRVYAQNEELRREIQRLRAWREAAQQLEQENARLRALNNVRLPPEMGFVTGEVIADSGGPFLDTGLVNVGWRDGVQNGAAVMDGAGLAGRVVGLGRRAARVLYVTDYSSRVPVVIRPSGRRAILAGDGTGAPRLDFLEDPEGIRPGDRIATSGDGSVFPPDLTVGIAVAGPDGAARVRLAADLERLEFVRILRYRPDTEIERAGGLAPPPQADAPEADAPQADAPDTGGAGGRGPEVGGPGPAAPRTPSVPLAPRAEARP